MAKGRDRQIWCYLSELLAVVINCHCSESVDARSINPYYIPLDDLDEIPIETLKRHMEKK